jgi:hypothetical protein
MNTKHNERFLPDLFSVSPEPELPDTEVLAHLQVPFGFDFDPDNPDQDDYFIFAYGVLRKQRTPGAPRTLKQAQNLKSPDWPHWNKVLSQSTSDQTLSPCKERTSGFHTHINK